eukprot:2872640-Prymnesium_polylepis.1
MPQCAGLRAPLPHDSAPLLGAREVDAPRRLQHKVDDRVARALVRQHLVWVAAVEAHEAVARVDVHDAVLPVDAKLAALVLAKGHRDLVVRVLVVTVQRAAEAVRRARAREREGEGERGRGRIEGRVREKRGRGMRREGRGGRTTEPAEAGGRRVKGRRRARVVGGVRGGWRAAGVQLVGGWWAARALAVERDRRPR